MAAWINAAQLKTKVSDLLQKQDESTLAFADSVFADSVNRAYLDIVSRLQARMYTQSQIDAWDRGAEYNLDIALYWVFQSGGVPANFSDQFIKNFDRRSELEKSSFRLVCSGIVVAPGQDLSSDAAGTIGYGVMNNAPPSYPVAGDRSGTRALLREDW
jgi:hypothetical protein